MISGPARLGRPGGRIQLHHPLLVISLFALGLALAVWGLPLGRDFLRRRRREKPQFAGCGGLDTATASALRIAPRGLWLDVERLGETHFEADKIRLAGFGLEIARDRIEVSEAQLDGLAGTPRALVVTDGQRSVAFVANTKLEAAITAWARAA